MAQAGKEEEGPRLEHAVWVHHVRITPTRLVASGPKVPVGVTRQCRAGYFKSYSNANPS